MGVLSQAMMTPVIITVVGCAILTPVMLKLLFSRQPAVMQESRLADRYSEMEQLDYVSAGLLDKNRELMGKKERK